MDMNFPQSINPICVATESGSLCWWNPAFQSLFRDKDLGAFGLRELLLEPEFESLCREAPAEKEVHIGAGNDRRVFLLSTYPLESKQGDPRPTLLIFLFRDKAEANLQSRMQGFTITAAAHDLANPVSAIFGYADLLLENPELPADSEREILSRIRNTAARAIELVKNYQILSQVEHHTFILPSGNCELNKVVSDVIDNSWRSGPAVPELVVALDPASIVVAVPRFVVERIAANLLNNACKYTPIEGRVVVETAVKEGHGVLSILNTPAYIPETERLHIFDRFSRGNAVKDIAGSGLGLFIVKTLANQVGAEISLSSSEENGTTFTLRFPL